MTEDRSLEAQWYATRVWCKLYSERFRTPFEEAMRQALTSVGVDVPPMSEQIKGRTYTEEQMVAMQQWFRSCIVLASREAWDGKRGPYKDWKVPD